MRSSMLAAATLLPLLGCEPKFEVDTNGCPKDASIRLPKNQETDLGLELRAVGGGSQGSANEGCNIVLSYIDDTRSDTSRSILNHATPEDATNLLREATKEKDAFNTWIVDEVLDKGSLKVGELHVPYRERVYTQLQTSGDPYRFFDVPNKWESPSMLRRHTREIVREFGDNGGLEYVEQWRCKKNNNASGDFVFTQVDKNEDGSPDISQWEFRNTLADEFPPTAGTHTFVMGRQIAPIRDGAFSDLNEQLKAENMSGGAQSWLSDGFKFDPERYDDVCKTLWTRQ